MVSRRFLETIAKTFLDDSAKETQQEIMPSSSVAKADEALKNLTVQEIQKGATTLPKGAKDMSAHKFWSTQPVPRNDDTSEIKEGPIEPEDPARVPKEPYPLIDGFEWVTMDLTDKKEIDDVYQLLYNNYVEDLEAMFRFNYSPSFLNWALKSPGWKKEWHVGIRATQSRKLLAFISAVPMRLRIKTKTLKCAEVNFLCVHKKLRAKRMAPVLIREVTRRVNLVSTWQAIYTAGVYLPTPVSTCRYYHRSLNWQKLVDVGFSQCPSNSTPARQLLKFKLPSAPLLNGVRPMKRADITAVNSLLKKYLDTMQLAQEFDEEEFSHWMLDEETPEAEKVIFPYVVETNGKITDFFSFYRIESTVIGNAKHDTLRCAYLFYYATSTVSDKEEDKAGLKKRLNELIHDALILSKKVWKLSSSRYVCLC